jgi:alkaline phosphatase D
MNPSSLPRRKALAHLAALPTLATLGACAVVHSKPTYAFKDTPFSLGVASGDPQSGKALLWTRLLPSDWDAGEPPDITVSVNVEVARDPQFKQLIYQTRLEAKPDHAHCLHVWADNLEPARPYWYRFHAGQFTSGVGTFKTAPSAGVVANLKIAIAGCQHFEHGYFGAYEHIVREAADLIVFTGDYIYEYGPYLGSPARTRQHTGKRCETLADYRRRYAQYKRDASLQAAHASAAWAMTWDDHEVDNDYAGLNPRRNVANFAAIRDAAYQAFFEHLPVQAMPTAKNQLYRTLHYGDLAKLIILDDRQSRDPQACLDQGRMGSMFVPRSCQDRLNPARTLLGATQERWLDEQLRASKERWQVVVQQTLMAPWNQSDTLWMDGWDGYDAARNRLIASLSKASNPLVIGGDVHSGWVADLKFDFEKDKAPAVATEICGTSITSPSGITEAQVAASRKACSFVHFGHTRERGYSVLDLNSQRTQIAMRAISDVHVTDPTVSTLASFQVLLGKPGAVAT